MSLENLLKIGQLKAHAPEPAEIERLLTAARRNLRDARVTSGYRPDTNRPGHHMTVIQSLPLTIGLDSKRIIVLDTLRRQRNVADYTGDDVDETTAEHCIAEAERLLGDIAIWRASQRPDLVRQKRR